MVKCVDCGFLSARNLGTRDLDEVEGEFRRSGNPPNQIMAGKEIGYTIHKRYPLCFVKKYDLLDSFNKTSGEESKRFLVVVNEERPCEPFNKWRQGFTPKEHQAIIDRRLERKWHWIELIAIIILTGLFAWFVQWISN